MVITHLFSFVLKIGSFSHSWWYHLFYSFFVIQLHLHVIYQVFLRFSKGYPGAASGSMIFNMHIEI